MADPLMEVTFGDARSAWRAGEELSGQARVTAADGNKVGAVEISVLWRTDGKGTTDTGVVWFESFPEAVETERLLPFRARLPQLPRTYHGGFIKIDWFVRVRHLGFLGNDTVCDAPFVVQ